MPVIREGDNVIIHGEVEHGVYPTHHEEIDQTVILRDNYCVYGGIYGRRLKVAGQGVVHGPIVTREDLFLDQTEFGRAGKDCQRFLSGLTAPAIIRNETQPYSINETCVTALVNALVQVRGPIMADTVLLHNAIIIGNIHARKVELHACVVFGIIECEDLLILNSCNFMAYRAGRVRLMGRLSTWLGYGISNDGLEFIGAPAGRPHLEPGFDTKGNKTEADLRFIPICLSGTACSRTDYFETCDEYHNDTCPSCKSGPALIPKVSLLDIDFQLRISRKGEEDPEFEVRLKSSDEILQKQMPITSIQDLIAGGTAADSITMQSVDGEWIPFYQHPFFQERCAVNRILSVAGRLLDGTGIRHTLSEITRLGRTIAFYPYLDAPSKEQVKKQEIFMSKGTRALYEIGIASVDIRPI